MTASPRFDEANLFAQAAIRHLEAEGIPPSPENYAVWFSYFAKQDPDLVRTIDVLRSNNEQMTPARSAELYAQYIGTGRERQVIENVAREVEAALGEMMSMLRETGRDTGRFGESLAEFSLKVNAHMGLEELQDVVRAMVLQTREMLERNRRLDSDLKANARKMERMRQDLEEVQKEAMTDGLTGIANRKYFDMTLRTAAAVAMEEGSPLCLLMIDIDHFKVFNDTYGHQVGDEVIKLVAHVLKQQVKGQDTPARYGGEEFAIVLPDTRLIDALQLAENIRRAVASKKIVRRNSGENLGSIALSLGGASYRPGESMSALIERADAALYLAKRAGRNRVASESELATEAEQA